MRKLNVDIEELNRRGKWLRILLQDISDEQLKLLTPSVSPEIIRTIKSQAAEAQIYLLAKN